MLAFVRKSSGLPLVAFVTLWSVALGACETRRQLSEWSPSDHQPPPTVTPENQGAGAQPTAANPGDTSRAAAVLFESRCASCHGAQGRGDGPSKPSGVAMPDMTNPAYRTARSDEELHAIIKNGRGLMPAFAAELTDLGIDALIKHVRTLSGS